MNHGLRKHAKYGMSGLYRHAVCHASANFCEAVGPMPESIYAKDGTEAHELLDFCLKNGHWSALEGSIAADTLERDTAFEAGERITAVQACIDYVANIMDVYDDAVLYVEHPFELPSFVTDEAWGTCDICIHIPSMRLVYIVDYKHGAGVAVELYSEKHGENKQALGYGAGAVMGSGHLDVDTAMLVIVQPRAFHPHGPVRERAVTKQRLADFVLEYDVIVSKCEDPNATFTPYDGKNNYADHCQFCDGRLQCPAREEKAVAILNQTWKSVKEVRVESIAPPETVTMERIAYVLAAKPYVMAFFNDYEKFAYAAAMSGNHVPGHKMVEAQAKRRWDGEPYDIAVGLMNLIGTQDWDVVYPRKLITITDADALVKKAYKDAAPRGKKNDAAKQATIDMAPLTIKESSGNLVLVTEDDGRPAVNRATIAAAQVVAIPASPYTKED